MKSKRFKDRCTDTYRDVFRFIRDSGKYIYAVIFVFCFFVLLGFFIPLPEEVAIQIIEYFRELLEQTQDYSSIQMIGFFI